MELWLQELACTAYSVFCVQLIEYSINFDRMIPLLHTTYTTTRMYVTIVSNATLHSFMTFGVHQWTTHINCKRKQSRTKLELLKILAFSPTIATTNYHYEPQITELHLAMRKDLDKYMISAK